MDYLGTGQVWWTDHARRRVEVDRRATYEEVDEVLSHSESDVPGDAPWKRELRAYVNGRTLVVVIAVLPAEVRVITIFDERAD